MPATTRGLWDLFELLSALPLGLLLASSSSISEVSGETERENTLGPAGATRTTEPAPRSSDVIYGSLKTTVW